MKNITLVLVGYKPAKKTDQYRTVFMKDATHCFFEVNKGLGMDLSAKLAGMWFMEVISIHSAAMDKINAIMANPSHPDFTIAQSFKLDETGKSLEDPIALSFNTMMFYLKKMGILNFTSQILADHQDCEKGVIYAIEFNF